MRLGRSLSSVFLILAAFSCKKKYEIIPADAKQIAREDKSEESEGGDVSLREYKFTVLDGQKNPQTFVCESRNFPDTAAAMAAAKKNIAERPQEELKSGKAHFALSGRSIWLRADRQLVWCMLASSGASDFAQSMQPVKELFLRRYKEES